MSRSKTTLLERMLVEEYRLHVELFGRGRFLAFPLVTAILVAGGGWLLALTDVSTETIIGGVYALVFFFGLQIGTIGLVGRDAMRNALGEMTLLVFTARTLPLSQRRLLAVFIFKDMLYYGVFFLTPIVIGLFPVLGEDSTPIAAGLLWITVGATFALGTGVSLALVGIGTRSTALLASVLGVVGGLFVVAPTAIAGVTPYAVYVEPTVTTALSATIVLACVLVAGLLLFEPATGRSLRRAEIDRFRRLRSMGDVYTARSLLEVTRSSGSVWKVVFSLGVLFAVTALLLDRLAAVTTLDPSGGIAFGTLLGLGTFTTYNWVTQFDDAREFLRYPDGLSAAFRGKLRTVLVLAVPAGTAYLAVATIWYPVTELLIGVVILPLVSVYVFGLTAYLTGFSPNELLFDTAMFAIYGAGLALLSVPLLVAALAYGTAPALTTGIALTGALVAGMIGATLARNAPARWHERLRAT